MFFARRLLATFMVFSLLMMGYVPSLANELPLVRVLVDGEELISDVPPQIVEGRTLLPLRAIFEALEAPVEWEQEARTVVSETPLGIMRLPIGSKVVTITTKEGAVLEFELDVPAQIIDGRTLMPVRFISEMLNALVGWNGSTRTVTIQKGKGGVGGFSPPLPERFLPDIFRSAEQIHQDAEDLRAYMKSVGYEVVLRPVAGNSIAVFDAEGFGAHEGLMTAVKKTVAEFDRVIGIRWPLLVVAMRQLDPLLEVGAFRVRLSGNPQTPDDQRFLWKSASGQSGVQAVSIYLSEGRAEGSYLSCFLPEVLGHELSNATQRQIMLGVRGTTSTYPEWLAEGVATLIGVVLTSNINSCSYERMRGNREVNVASVQEGTTPLRGYEDTVRKDRGYGTAHLAVEYLQYLLVQSGRAQGIADFSWYSQYWTLLGQGVDPDQAFLEATGVPLERFYDMFGKYQESGYPELFPLNK